MIDAIKAFEGVWQASEGTLGGQPMASEIVNATRLEITRERYRVDLAGTIDSGLCEIDSSTTPIRMTIKGESGPNAGRTFLAILELMGESSLRIAYYLSGSDFPASFSPIQEKTNCVATFVRVSK